MQILDKLHSMLRGSTGSARTSNRTSMVVEKVEPRILHSADLAPVLAGSAPLAVSVEQRVIEPEAVAVVAPAAQSEPTHLQELVFIDPHTPNYQQLVNDIRSEADNGRDIAVILLDSRSDGVAQITAALSGRNDIRAIHIISHGGDGAVQIGSSLLDTQTLRGYASELRSWSAALAPGADLLIYGCDVAALQDGRTFVDTLSALTGAVVAASDNATGAASLGGDWVLEYSTGAINARIAVTDYMQSQWSGLLNVATLQASQDTYIIASTGNNYGASTQLIVDKSGGSVGNQRVLVEFDLSALTGATINSATLQMQATAVGAAMNIDVYELRQSWSEGTGNATPGAASWIQSSAGTNWTTAGGNFNSTAVATLNATAAGQQSWDLTSLVQAWVNGTKANNGILIGSPDAGGATVTYDSREGSTAPRLVINYANTAPALTGANDLSAISEDPATNPGTLVAALISAKVNDPDIGAQSGIAVTAVDNTNGSWEYSLNGGASWTAFGTPTAANARLLAADAASTYVRFVPNANWNGTVTNGLTFRAWDQTSGVNGGTADTTLNGGNTAFSSATASNRIIVNSVNDAPAGANNTVSTPEDTGYVFSSTDFGFSDPNDSPANALLAVKITTVPGAGTLSLSGTAASAGQFVSVTDINAGNLVFTPAPNANGTGYASFTFQVQDNGGTANGGVDLDPVARSMVINVTAVNDAPVNSVPGAQNTAMNTAVIFSSGNGNAISVSDVDAGSNPIQVALAVSNGTLTLAGISGLTFSVGTGAGNASMTFSGTIADINAALNGLRYDPTPAFTGSENLNVTANDLGNSGAGGPKSATNTVVINVAFVNFAPVLSGANNLSAINEDPATNPGTSVSALIAGYVSDANAGALSGIAVTAVDNTYGSWQYTINGGSTWIGFGTPSAASARLLAADGNTYVRFVPNANWNGAVTNGLTFRAWDQTSGAAGGTADTTSATNTVFDSFNSVSYSNNDGTASWSAGWVDTDGNPSSGSITVTGGQLVLSTLIGTDSIYREANLSGATSATLSFSYNNLLGLLGTVSLEASNNGGTSYTTLATFSSGSNTGSGIFSTDISAYIAANTRIQLVMSGVLLGGSLHADDVQISYVTPLNGGNTAFSTSTASSSITVSAVNDAPTLSAPASTAVTEDVASAITGISFSDVDAGSASVLASFSVPQGTLAAVSGGGVTVGGSASALTLSGSIANINAFIAGSNLTYTTAPNDTSAVTLGVSIDDQGNTGSGGALSATANVTLNVTAVNDAPAGANNTVSTPEDTGYVFSSTDFGFSDPNDSPANALLAVKITTVPGAGTLTLSGAAVSAGQFVSVTDISAGNLVFTPALNANGSGYASFTFQVQDNGGIATGGVDLDPVARTMSIDVSAVNDAPIAIVPGPQSTAINATLVFSTAGGNAISIGDPDAGASPIQVSLSVANGTLTLASAAGLAFSTGSGSGDNTMTFTGSITAINTALDGLAFTPIVGYSGSTVLSLTVDDLGNTGSGGALTAGGNVMIAVALPAPATAPPAGGPAIVISPAGQPVVTTSALPNLGAPSAISAAAPAVTPAPHAPGATTSEQPQAEQTASILPPDSTPTGRSGQNALLASDSSQSTHFGRGSNVAFGGRDLRLLLATSGQPEVALAEFALTSRDSQYATETAIAALRSTDLLNELDRLREGLQDESRSDAHAIALTAAATLGLSVGYVFWLLRGGVLLSTLLSSMPAWRLVDPLPILGRLEDDDDEAGDADESLESLVARQNRARDGEQSEPEPA